MFIEPQSIWDNPTNRRKFYEDYASEHNFDPLVPSNWLKQSSTVESTKVCPACHLSTKLNVL